MLFWGWLGGYKSEGGEAHYGRLLTIEELGKLLQSRILHKFIYIALTDNSPCQSQGPRRDPP